MINGIKISVVVAVSQNGVIGKNNDLPWRIPRDLRRFRDITKDNIVLMGRKTFESLKEIPLPDRLNFVVTTKKYPWKEGLVTLSSLETAINTAVYAAQWFGKREIFVIGGAQIYNETLLLCDKVYLTTVKQEIENGDVFFEFKNKDDFDKIYSVEYDDHVFEIYERIIWELTNGQSDVF